MWVDKIQLKHNNNNNNKIHHNNNNKRQIKKFSHPNMKLNLELDQKCLENNMFKQNYILKIFKYKLKKINSN